MISRPILAAAFLPCADKAGSEQDAARNTDFHMRSLNRNLRSADVEVHKEPLCPAFPALCRLRGRAGRRTTGVAALAVALAACSSLGGLTGNDAPAAPASTSSTTATSSNVSFASRVKTLFAGDSTSPTSPAPQPANASAAPAADIECPSVEYRQGAATLAVNTPGAEPSALSVRYQASFTQTARECVAHDNSLTIKVGVQGRIVVGPAGAPSSITIPLRYALVREGLDSKTLWTKLFMVPVTIPQNQLNVPWLHIEEEMTIPRPSADELEAYVIYVGFDPESDAPAKPKRAVRPKVTR
jgi:hypothetical protein